MYKIKLFFYWNFKKEEVWLKQMAKEGYILKSIRYCIYEFVECDPKEYQICLTVLNTSIKSQESINYIKFLKETGLEYIDNKGYLIYLKKKYSDGDLETFSDNESKLNETKRAIKQCLYVSRTNLYVGISNILISMNNNQIWILASINILVGLIALFSMNNLFKMKKELEKELTLFE